MSPPTARPKFTWTAMTCRLEQTDVYIGLAAGLDDLSALRFSAAQLAAYPMQRIRVTAANGHWMPLRFYAVRDPSIVQVELTEVRASEPGFAVARLIFQATAGAQAASNETHEVVVTAAIERVMGFIVTIGLKPEQEESFMTTVLSEFLQKTWMTMPKLLRDIGCADPTQLVSSGGGGCTS